MIKSVAQKHRSPVSLSHRFDLRLSKNSWLGRRIHWITHIPSRILTKVLTILHLKKTLPPQKAASRFNPQRAVVIDDNQRAVYETNRVYKKQFIPILKQDVPGGIGNNGYNTCFLNSYISSLFASKSTVAAIFNNIEYDQTVPLERQKKLADLVSHLRKLYLEITNGQLVSRDDSQALRMKLHRLNPTLVPGGTGQDDARGAHMVVCEAIGIKTFHIDETYHHLNKDATTPVDEVERTNKPPGEGDYNTLDIGIHPIQPRSEKRIVEAYDLQHLMVELLDERETKVCTRGNDGKLENLPKGTRTYITQVLSSPPPQLMPLWVNRNSYSSRGDITKKYFKLLNTSDLYVPVDDRAGKYAHYKRVAAAIHAGVPDGGHWVSYVEREWTNQDGQIKSSWFSCNDDFVTRVDDNLAESKLEDGSYFFYELQEIVQEKP